jgi:ABC-2 type transport system permease protein
MRTMIWKEWKEFLQLQGSSRAGSIGRMTLPIVVLSILIPWRAGAAYTTNSTSAFLVSWILLFVVSSVTTDSFAGERERHTLESLLATRLSDDVILLGKIMASVLFACAMSIASVILGLVIVNVAHGHGQLLMFSWTYAVTLLVFSFLASLLVCCVGVLISLRAATVRQASGTLVLVSMGVFFGGIFLVQALPVQWRTTLMQTLAGGNLVRTQFIAAIVLIVLNLALFAVTRARFRRARLTLD